MGQTLSEPIVNKHTETGFDKRVLYAVSDMQGWRLSMEDAHTTVLKLLDDQNNDTGASFFGVYDGHGGPHSANFSGRELHRHIVRSPSFAKNQYEQAVREGFLEADKHLRENIEYHAEYSGCTAICGLITRDNVLYVGNAGDSRAVLSSDGRAVLLSTDHKPMNTQEKERIVKAGGFIEFGRVNGNLALSRAIGDFEFKQNHNLPPEEQVVTADPEITEHQLTPEDDFIVLACDGIWDCLPSQFVIDYIHKHLALGMSPSAICEAIMSDCLATGRDNTGVGCDNMTIIIVGLLHGKTPEEWQTALTERFNERHPGGVGSPRTLSLQLAAEKAQFAKEQAQFDMEGMLNSMNVTSKDDGQISPELHTDNDHPVIEAIRQSLSPAPSINNSIFSQFASHTTEDVEPGTLAQPEETIEKTLENPEKPSIESVDIETEASAPPPVPPKEEEQDKAKSSQSTAN
ncbi:Protein phosphatase 2C 2 [Dispira simplex]|nr:Protein phosphatase 2C 2 [Dispira simplex]